MKSQYEYLIHELISKTVRGREIKTQNGGEMSSTSFVWRIWNYPGVLVRAKLINMQLVS